VLPSKNVETVNKFLSVFWGSETLNFCFVKDMRNTFRFTYVLAVAALTSAVLSGCAPILIGQAAYTTSSVLLDRRSAGAVANDGLIETKATLHLSQSNFTSSHITATSYEGNVLLSGEIGKDDEKEKAEEIVKSINEVERVYNHLVVGPNVSLSTRMSDSVTAGKVRASLIDKKGISINSVKVVVDDGVCYILGVVTEEEAAKIAQVASRVEGVKKVVKLFTIITPEELKRRELSNEQNSEDASSSDSSVQERSYGTSGADSSSGVEVGIIR
jgi:osmotically-inducible protein OsmY